MQEVITQLHGPELKPKSGGKAKQLVILLHGLGADGKDLIGLAPEFAEVLPDAHFVSPNAPFNCDMSPFGYQWFSLQSWTPESMYEGAVDVAPILNNFIDKQLKELGLKDKDMALVGFSQGTMMALHVGLRRTKSCAVILGYSGSLLESSNIKNEVFANPEICLIHGVLDPVVPFMALDKAVNALKNLGINTERHARSFLAHGIDSEGIEIGKAFLKKIFLK